MLGICLGHQALGQVLGGKLIMLCYCPWKASLIEHKGQLCFKDLPIR